MTRINILPPLVADMIAAGEVVERPASVIKELIENSFDAGARKVTVEFKGGGATYIRISDDGCGMSPEDAGIAFTRHATSKLRDEKGLEAIGTMGFRGEALAAIAAVSRIELITREKGAEEGTKVTVEGGDIVDMLPCGCPEGTTITVRDIFHNTPARLKFLKSDRSEATACITAALNEALGRPDVSVRCKRDGEEVFFTPGDGRAESAVYSLLGRDTANTMLPVSGERESMSVEGFTSSPAAGRGNRANQHFYCNGRYIKSALLQAAVEQAYKNTLLTGRFPSCVMYVSLSNAAVDVNVHPAKTEVKFSDERKVFDLVYQAVRMALEAESKPIEISLSEGTRRAVAAPKADFFQSMSASEYREKAEQKPAARPVLRSSAEYHAQDKLSTNHSTFYSTNASTIYSTKTDAFSQPSTRRERISTPFDDAAPIAEKTLSKNDENSKNVEKPEGNSTKPENREMFSTFSTQISTNSVEEPAQEQLSEHAQAAKFRVVGEVLDTYIIAELGEEMLLIDKHAAHERMIFDRLKAQERSIMSQTLLAPIIIKPTAPDAEMIEQNSTLFDRLGFEIEPFGASEYAVRALPDDIDPPEAAGTIEEICGKLRANSLSPEGARDEILHTVACKAAIKAGRKHDVRELERIAAAVIAGEVKYCPHGRPVSVLLTRKELDKQFKRIV